MKRKIDKIFSLIVAIVSLLLLCGCTYGLLSNNNTAQDIEGYYCGTWAYYGIEYDGVIYKAKKIDEMYNANLSDYYFVLMSDGTGYDYVGEDVDVFDWRSSSEGVIIDGMEFISDGGMIYGRFDTYTAYYYKVSESQDFPREQKTMGSAKVTTAPEQPTMTTISTEAESIIMYATDGIPVRTGPGITYDSVGRISVGEAVEVIGRMQDWYIIKFDGGNYYVSSRYLSTEKPTEEEIAQKTPASTTTASLTTKATSASNDGIRPEFKAAMDSYEKFFDDYVAFMQKYMSTSSEDPIAMLDMLQEYLTWLEDYATAMEDFEAIANSDMSTAEALYYVEVSLRIEQKLLSAMY